MKTIRVVGLNASPSTLNQWMESPEVVRLEKLEGWRPKWRAGTWFGTCFHRINEMTRPGEKWEDRAAKIWKQEKNSVRAKCRLQKDVDKAELECAVAGLMCRLYYEHHAGGRDWQVMKREELVQMDYPVEIDGVRYLIPLKGYIDAILRTKYGRADWIFDSKTRATVKQEQSEVLLDYDLQMQFYRWVLPRVGYELGKKHVKRKVAGIVYDQIRKPYMRNYVLNDETLEKIEKRVRAEMPNYFVRFQHTVTQRKSDEWEETQFRGLMNQFARWLIGFYEQHGTLYVRREDPFQNPYHHLGKLVGMYGPTDFMPIVMGKKPRTFERNGRTQIRFERVD